MKSSLILAQIFCLSLLCLAQAKGRQLTGLDIYVVSTETAADSIAFSFENYEEGKTIRGLRSLAPLLTRSDISSVTLKAIEFNGAPLDIISISFKPEIQTKLTDALKAKSTDVLFTFCGKPRAIVKINDMLRLVSQKQPVLFMHPATEFNELVNLPSILKKVMAGTRAP